MNQEESELIGKTVMDEKGIPIGVITNLLIDNTSEGSPSILIKPSELLDKGGYEFNSHGNIIVSLKRINPVKNIVILEKNHI
jgi:sporulation protein YlmC with PRC-barrel domain